MMNICHHSIPPIGFNFKTFPGKDLDPLQETSTVEGQSLEEKGTELPTARTRGAACRRGNKSYSQCGALGGPVGCQLQDCSHEKWKNSSIWRNGWLPDLDIRCCFHENPLPSLPPPKKAAAQGQKKRWLQTQLRKRRVSFFFWIYIVH